jgi:hypothetical protein
MTSSTKRQELVAALRRIVEKCNAGEISADQMGNDIVQEFAGKSEESDSPFIYSEFEQIFDLAADIELGEEHAQDFEHNVLVLKYLIEKL